MKRILALTTAAAMTAATLAVVAPTVASAQPSGAYVNPGYGGDNYRGRDSDRRDWNRRGDRRWDDRRHYRHRDRDGNWGAAAAGTLFGLALGSAATSNYRGSDWRAHVNWCSSRYQTYNPRTDLYFYVPGRQRHCNSPYA